MYKTSLPSPISFFPLFLSLLSYNRVSFAFGIFIGMLLALKYIKVRSATIIPKWMVVLISVNLISLVISNLMNGYSLFENPQVYYVAILILVGSILFDTLKNIVERKIFVFSCFSTGPVTYLLDYENKNYVWKYFLGISVVFWILIFVKSKLLTVSLLVGSLILSWSTKADILFFITLLSLILVLIHNDYDNYGPSSGRTKNYLVFGLVFLFCLCALIIDFYTGRMVLWKSVMLELFTGRSEFWINIELIGSSPILGRGSAYIPSSQELYAAFDLAKSSGFNLRENIVYYWGNPNQNWLQSHSWIASYWIKGGLGAILMWLGIIAMSIKSILSYSRKQSVVIPVLACTLVWDILFSPVNALSGFEVLVFLVLLEMEENNDNLSLGH